MAVAELVTPVAAGLLTAAVAGPVLRRLPEPVPDPADPDPDLATKPTYASLSSPRSTVALGIASLAASVGVTTTQPTHSWPGWLVLATLGVLLAMIDGRTTWLPRVLTQTGWLLGVGAAGTGLLLGGTAQDAARAVVGGLAAGAFFLVFWWLSRGGIAFGDVRLAPLIGLAGAGPSWSVLLLTLLSGALAGAVHAVWRHLRGHRHAFPYAPGLVVGALLAAPLAVALSATG